MQAPSVRSLIDLPRVWDRLDRVETRLLEASEASDPHLTKIAQHLLIAGGKRFRPLLCLLAAEFGPSSDERAVEAAVSVELIHVGSLYHDDVIDEAVTRRGAASANALWGNTHAILAGDFLMARASEVAAASLGTESVRLLASTYANLVEGQTIELQLDNDLSHGPDEYFRVIEGKTASLIRTSARLGAMAADAPGAVVQAISDWAGELGVVFQITDDALDLVATDEFLGKPAGSDIGEGTFTLPVLYALRSSDGERIRDSLGGGGPYSNTQVQSVIEIVRGGGHVDRALDEAERRIELGGEAAAKLPDIPARAVLGSMGRFLIDQVAAARD